MQLKADNDLAAYNRAVDYLAALPRAEVHSVVRYRTDRGADFGVVVNVGDKVSVWNAFKEQIEKYNLADFQNRQLALGAAK
jgi:2-phospho-L-lactate transferase/gluconeogenesis factor (CofD/UPF0052 family)